MVYKARLITLGAVCFVLLLIWFALAVLFHLPRTAAAALPSRHASVEVQRTIRRWILTSNDASPLPSPRLLPLPTEPPTTRPKAAPLACSARD